MVFLRARVVPNHHESSILRRDSRGTEGCIFRHRIALAVAERRQSLEGRLPRHAAARGRDREVNGAVDVAEQRTPLIPTRLIDYRDEPEGRGRVAGRIGTAYNDGLLIRAHGWLQVAPDRRNPAVWCCWNRGNAKWLSSEW